MQNTWYGYTKAGGAWNRDGHIMTRIFYPEGKELKLMLRGGWLSVYFDGELQGTMPSGAVAGTRSGTAGTSARCRATRLVRRLRSTLGR